MSGMSEQVLAGKFDFAWDIGMVVWGLVRIAFGHAPGWVKFTVFGLVGAMFAWTGIRWVLRRGAASRLPVVEPADETPVRQLDCRRGRPLDVGGS
ncbi:hypothetical protein GCM10020367_10810 [Streptomyces sannanensis]|uniref:Uncharacterized protein n=1 Tax=Streptomyces sannanensis TaxID=285536 RepID=A0ABP6S663_9ACTN